MNKDLKSMSRPQIERIVLALDREKYLAKYIFSFIHSMDVGDIGSITPLSKSFRNELIEHGYYVSRLTLVEKLSDPDGTVKYIFDLPASPDSQASRGGADGAPALGRGLAIGNADGGRIQTVLLSDDDRKTLCISTQAGCAMGCVFCATGRLGLARNLTAGEIVDQVNRAEVDGAQINNVVYMGMGEPLLNYDNVLKSVRILNHPQGKNIGLRHLTVSTCGDADAIRKLANENIHPRLAISLNAPTDTLRSKIMPINKKYPIKTLLAAVKYYQMKTDMRVTFEYILIKGLNDSALHAQMFAKLAYQVKCNINLIEYNPHPFCHFDASSSQTIKRFAQILDNTGIETVIRLKKGRKIKAACGQLGTDLLRYDNQNQ